MGTGFDDRAQCGRVLGGQIAIGFQLVDAGEFGCFAIRTDVAFIKQLLDGTAAGEVVAQLAEGHIELGEDVQRVFINGNAGAPIAGTGFRAFLLLREGGAGRPGGQRQDEARRAAACG